MADPTLKDVMKALAALAAEVRADIADVKADIADVKADVTAHRAETKKGFADLDKELEAHAERSHRDIEKRLDKVEKDVGVLKGRPAASQTRRTRTAQRR